MVRPTACPLPTGKLEIAYAVTDKVVVIGSGAGFVKARARHHRRPPRSRRTTDLQEAGRPGRHRDRQRRTWTSKPIRGLIEKAAADGKADAAELKKYETDVKPFLVPFDAMFAAGSIDGDLTRSVIHITVK